MSEEQQGLCKITLPNPGQRILFFDLDGAVGAGIVTDVGQIEVTACSDHKDTNRTLSFSLISHWIYLKDIRLANFIK
jgi:hypothetical protein